MKTRRSKTAGAQIHGFNICRRGHATFPAREAEGREGALWRPPWIAGGESIGALDQLWPLHEIKRVVQHQQNDALTVGQQYVAFLGRRQGGQGLAIIGDG